MKEKTKYDWQCLECGGDGCCPTCLCDGCCPHCNGDGIDPLAVDIAAYQRDCELLNEEAKARGIDNGWSWDVLDDDCVTIGRENDQRQALIVSHMK